MAVRYEMSKLRTMTFKKIYDLHKQVQIAENLELGYRRLSVASATEIERERRHHSTKIRRQLTTLNNQIGRFNHGLYQKNLKEIIDVQSVMSDSKLKAFFSVFVQCFCQTLCDIALCYDNLNCFVGDMNADHIHGNQWEKERMERIKKVCLEFYGINHILDPIVVDKTPTPSPSQAITPSIYSKGSIRKIKSPQRKRDEEEEMSVAEKIV